MTICEFINIRNVLPLTKMYPEVYSRDPGEAALDVYRALHSYKGTNNSRQWRCCECVCVCVLCLLFIWASARVCACVCFAIKPLWSSVNCSHKQAPARCEPRPAEDRWRLSVSGIHKQTGPFCPGLKARNSWPHVYSLQQKSLSPTLERRIQRQAASFLHHCRVPFRSPWSQKVPTVFIWTTNERQ